MPRKSSPPVPPNEVIHIGTRKRFLSIFLYAAAVALRARNALQKANPKRVDVPEPVGLGDVISFEPLVRELLAQGYEVVFGAKPEWRPLFPERPGFIWQNLRLPWATHNEQIKYELGRYFRDPTRGDLRALRACGRGATGLDTRGDIRSVLLLYLAGCKRVISLTNYLGSDLPMSRWAAGLVPFDNSLRRWELNTRFLEALPGSFDAASVARPRLAHLIRRTHPRRAALMPIAPWAGKLWPRERWGAVIDQLRAGHWEVAALCGPQQSGAAREQTGSTIPVVECGSIDEWAREFNQCAFVITLDSGPMHLADALDVPVIALFGQGKLPLWAPSGVKSVVISRRDSEFFVCHPIEANTHLGEKYMNRITVDDVLTAVRGLDLDLPR